MGALIQDVNAAFYGVTAWGGDYGTIFKVTPDGEFSTAFCFSASTGYRPLSGLTPGKDGALYGTTSNGGPDGGYGTIFRFTSNSNFTVIAQFDGTNGATPSADLLLASDGKFYGTTAYGQLAHWGAGSVFSVTTNGLLTPLYFFSAQDGLFPTGKLIESTDGNFYGTTQFGGASDAGTIFRFTPVGTLTNLFSFSGTNGAHPVDGLTEESDGTFYGTTASGGEHNLGTVFKLSTNGILTTIFSFDETNGSSPQTRLLKRADGALYGTTLSGGEFGNGTVFKITHEGAFTLLASCNPTTGCSSCGALLEGQDKNLYGTMANGGQPNALGTVFRIVDHPTINAITITSALPTLTWSSFPGGAYHIERSSDINETNWVAFTNTIKASSYSQSFSDTSADLPNNRFYRVRLAPWEPPTTGTD